MSETVIAPASRHENAASAARVRPRLVVTCTWDQVPHLDDAAKQRLLSSYPEYQRDARSKGVPSLGAGSIYRVPESDIIVKPFEIPRYWPRGYGFDVGWNRTAAAFGAHDRETDTIYLYAVHYRAHAEPSVHSEAIRAHAKDWMPGRIDPAARGRSQEDGRKLIETYREKGLLIGEADHAVESGIQAVYERLSTGKLKIFETLGEWRAEYRLYRRDEKGQIVKKFDHLMDATRYLILSGVSWMVVPPVGAPSQSGFIPQPAGGHGWLGG